MVCSGRGARLTEQRRRVLELVWSGHRPLGAYDILEALSGEGGRVAPPTVYRALDFLQEQGLVHRLESLNAYVGCCATDDTGHAGQFLICQNCGVAAEIADTRIEAAIRDSAAEAGFAIARPTIEIEGMCPHCRTGDA